MPVLFPRNAEEIVTFGLHGVALSRASGCVVALKIVADVADGAWTVDGDFADFDIVGPRRRVGGQAVDLPAAPDGCARRTSSSPRPICTARDGRWCRRTTPPTTST